jgi:hypothetical protein
MFPGEAHQLGIDFELVMSVLEGVYSFLSQLYWWPKNRFSIHTGQTVAKFRTDPPVLDSRGAIGGGE